MKYEIVPAVRSAQTLERGSRYWSVVCLSDRHTRIAVWVLVSVSFCSPSLSHSYSVMISFHHPSWIPCWEEMRRFGVFIYFYFFPSPFCQSIVISLMFDLRMTHFSFTHVHFEIVATHLSFAKNPRAAVRQISFSFQRFQIVLKFRNNAQGKQESDWEKRRPWEIC